MSFGTVFVIIVALMIGWATPQPKRAKKLTDMIVAKFKELAAK